MEPTTIELTKRAGEMLQEARSRMDELKETIRQQQAGELDADSRLSAEEIASRKQEIDELIAEAKAVEGVADTDDVLSRPADQLSPAARRILQSEEGGDERDKEKAAPFPKIIDFLKGVAATQGYEDYSLSGEQNEALRYLRGQATKIERYEPLETKDLGDLDLKTLVGDDTGSTGRGDFLVPTEHMAELLRTMGEQQVFASRARRVPMSRRTIDFPRLVQTDATDTRPFMSFAAITKIGESTQKPEREPVFEQLTLTAIKYAAYTEASDELLSDSIVDVPPVLIELLTSAIAYEYDRDTMRGSGSSEPQGFIGSDAEYAQNRATSGNIALADIWDMDSRFFGDSGIWLYHPSTIPELYALAASNVIAWQRDVAASTPGTLLGRPLVRSHKLPSLNAKGDLCLVDPSFYLVGDLQRVTVANSIHAQFRQDVTAWRATFRAAGTPWPAGTFSHEASGGSKTWEVSPFVVLDIVAS